METLTQADRDQLATCNHDVAYCAACKATWGLGELKKDALCPECETDLTLELALHLDECNETR